MAADPEPWIQGWRRVALASGMLIFPLVTAVGVSQSSTGASAWGGYVIVITFCCCYFLATTARSSALSVAAVEGSQVSWRRYWLLMLAMTVLVVAELPFAHAEAFFLLAVPVAMAAASPRRSMGIIVAACALASLVVPWLVTPWHDGLGWDEALSIVFTALMWRAISQMLLTNRALLVARAEIAQLAADAERTRIARDLHDLLGHSLTAITVKAGLARRLGPIDTARSLREIAAVEELARQTLVDVRAAVSNYRGVSLAGELARGRELLRTSGVAADLPTATDMVAMANQELLAWAVREGLTNVVRHAHASRCTVTLSSSEVEICDDGVGGQATFGSGLTGLRERVAAVGGRVEAGPLVPRGWRLHVALDPATIGSA